jgi:hypothetical protein
MSDPARLCGVHALDSGAGQSLRVQHGITTRDLQRARTRYPRVEGLPWAP